MADPPARHPPSPLEDELRAIAAWWREAGVDQSFADAPQNWLAEDRDEESADDDAAPVVAQSVSAAPLEQLAGGPGAWPTTLDAFDRWWLAEPALALGPRPRIPQRGPTDAELMVLVPQPEAEDSDILLSGPQGALLANILAACGVAPENCRVASLIPSHLPHPEWPALDRAGWGALARRHLALAAPRRLIVFGEVALPLLGHDPTQGAAGFNEVEHEGGKVSALGARGLDTLLLRPRLQASLWQRWLEWTDG